MTRRQALVFALGIASALGAAPASGADWKRYDDCRLVPGRYADGDSFHVTTPAGEKICRLYFVDAPETETNFPERVKEQAEYFEISRRRTIEIGKMACDFTGRFLRDGFTVFTRGEDAEGRSALPREFALIRADGRWLDLALVEAGLARVYGKSVALPDGTTAKRHWSDLREAEQKAKAARAGAWSGTAGPAKSGERDRATSGGRRPSERR